MSSALETLRRDFGGGIIEPGGAEYGSASRSLLASGKAGPCSAASERRGRQYDPGNLFARNHNVRPH